MQLGLRCIRLGFGRVYGRNPPRLVPRLAQVGTWLKWAQLGWYLDALVQTDATWAQVPVDLGQLQIDSGFGFGSGRAVLVFWSNILVEKPVKNWSSEPCSSPANRRRGRGRRRGAAIGAADDPALRGRAGDQQTPMSRTLRDVTKHRLLSLSRAHHDAPTPERRRRTSSRRRCASSRGRCALSPPGLMSRRSAPRAGAAAAREERD